MSDDFVSEEPAKGSRFFATPSSTVGRSVPLLFVIAVAGVVLMATVIEPMRPAWRAAIGLAVVASVLAMAVCGSIAVLAKRERSWLVILPTALAIAIVLNEVVQQLRAL